MGNELFGVDIAGIVADNVGPAVLPVSLSKPVRGARQPGNLTGGLEPQEPVVYTAQGFYDDITGTPPPDFKVNDRKAVIIGDTLPAGVVPEKDWEITIEGITLTIERLLSRDPAAAVYAYLCRDRAGPDGV